MKAALPPGPTEPRLAQMMQWISRPMAFATKQRDRYGDTFTANIDGHPWVMLGDPDDVRTVFTAGPQRTNAGEANAVLRPTLGSHSLLLLDGEEHLRQRKLMLPAFHGERIERYREIMRDATERAVASWRTGEPFALRPHTQAITFEVIVRAVFGVDDAGAMARLREPLRRMLDWAGNPAPLLLVAVVGPENPVVRRVIGRRYLEPVDRELYALIAARRESPDLAERQDVLSTLLLARDEDGEPMSDVELRDELLTLLVAGHETTATSLAWAVERLVRHPGALDRVATDAEYADAVVKETLRLRPVVAIVLRRLLEPLQVAGRELPAGTTVAPCILLVHRREDLYPEPDAFRPERFLREPAGTYSWIPFGGGVRRCLGAAFAQVEMQVVLETIARSARLEAVGEPEEVRRRGVTLVPARGGQVRMAAG
jgi:cytochrome P450 family 135